MGMEVAHCLAMTARRTKLLLVSLALTADAYLLSMKPSSGTLGYSQRHAEASLPAAENTQPPCETAENPAAALPPPLPSAEAARPPVQTVEERGDALLFESEALFGTPFDQAVLMPFE
jgi:hypothetical protein